MRKPLLFAVGLPLTMALMSIAIDRVLHSSAQEQAALLPPPPPMTAQRYYGASRAELESEFGKPHNEFKKRYAWATYGKDNTELRVRYDDQGKTQFVMASAVSCLNVTEGTTNEFYPPIRVGKHYLTFSPSTDNP